MLGGTADPSAVLWDLQSGKELYFVSGGNNGHINSVAFKKSGDTFVIGSDDGRVYFYNTATGQQIHRIG